ncbi:MAG TPA: hypothetical protein ENN09_00580 [Planctomycetes bacterium]|nr:hypothetical protein [Planctomycetota bacterium]
MALILVVVCLTAMLMLGTIFMHNIRLDLAAAANYARSGQTEIYALEGLHRAMAELMYDVWGVNEDRAFVCAGEWGQLSRGYDVGGTPIVAAYVYEGPSGREQVIAPASVLRRTRTEVIGSGGAVQTDFRWVDKNTLANAYPTHSGGWYWDGFLPGHTDNYDAFEAALAFNHGTFTDRNYCKDAANFGGRWGWALGYPGQAGWYAPWFPRNNHGPKPAWDYIDTRIAPDAFYHVFRFDLVAPDDFKVHGTGVREQDPKQAIYDYRRDGDFRATHLGFATAWGGADPWGGALNINQVNNNYNWEVYYNFRAAPDVPEFSELHFKEAKWIHIYAPAGDRIIGRYAVTVWPDCGTPNPNYMFDGRGTLWLYTGYHTALSDSAQYFKALDTGFSPHGFDQWVYPAWRSPVDRIKSTTVVGRGGSWDFELPTRFAEHAEASGLFTGRSEVNMLIRKWGFDPDAVSPEQLASEATLLAAMTAPNSYEYMLDQHWEQDRLIIDSYGLWGSDPTVRRSFTKYLQDLRYYWGPDERTGIGDEFQSTQYRDYDPDHYGYTPYRELRPDYLQPATEWDARAREAKGNLLVSLWGAPAWWMYDRYFINPNTLELAKNLSTCRLAGEEWIGPPTAAGKAGFETANFYVNEIGLFRPNHPEGVSDEDCYFIELVAAWNSGWGPGGARYSLSGDTQVLLGSQGNQRDAMRLGGAFLVGEDRETGNCRAVAPADAWHVVLHTWPYSASSAARRLASTYMVLYIPVSASNELAGADEVIITHKNGRVHQKISLPGALGELHAGQSYSAFDFYNADSPLCFHKVEATPAWRRHPDGKLWHGQNANHYSRFWPAYRVDIENTARMGDFSLPGGHVNYIMAGREAQMHDAIEENYDGTPYYAGVIPNLRLRPERPLADIPIPGVAARAASPDGYYDPYREGLDPWERTYILHHYYDPDLIMWRNLSESAPLDRLFSWGMQTRGFAGPLPLSPKNLNRQFSPFDGIDNNFDGRADEITETPLIPGNPRGWYQSDRKAMGRYNVNEIPHPAAAIAGPVQFSTAPTLIIGRKPLKGYTTFWQLNTRSIYYSFESDTPYDTRLWYENLFADCSSDHTHANPHIQYQCNELSNPSRSAHTGNSPIHTVYITAQTVINDQANPAILLPTNEIKIRATVERTWDGKMNIVEFNWIPQDGCRW